MHEFRDLLFDYVAEHRDQMAIVDLQPFVCPDGFPCPVEIDGVRLRPDGAHFSEETAGIVAAPDLAVDPRGGARAIAAARVQLSSRAGRGCGWATMFLFTCVVPPAIVSARL